MSDSVMAYKVFNPDWTCRGFQYEVGGTYHHSGDISICDSGFHACVRITDCFNYYDFDPSNKVAVVRMFGEVITDNSDKSCCSDIEIVSEITWEEVLRLCNTGKANTGNCNSGNRNSGNRNSGNCNSGNRNSGHCNSGHCNSGNRNSGNYNSGNCNSGNYNSGNYNSGNYNSGNYNSGFFNTDEPTVRMFNKNTEKRRSSVHFPNFFYNLPVNTWVYGSDMTEEEMKKYPDYTITGGYLKTLDYKEAWQKAYIEASHEDKALIKQLPNFDADIFEEITGVRVE